MPTLMATETTETTYYSDGSAKQKTSIELETFKNKGAYESEDETLTYYMDDTDKADDIMLEADIEFYVQEADIEFYVPEMAEA